MRAGRYFTLAALCFVLAVMLGLVSYSTTLYRLFCQVTGAGGTTQRVASDTAARSGRMVTVFFDTSVQPGMPWRFAPVQRSVRVHLGQDTLVFFSAENLADQPIVGHATFNVTPDKAGIYFKKIQCFCFTEERLGAHQKVQMPVDFFVDPRLATDPDTADVDQITLSYTFFVSRRPAGAQDLERFRTVAAVSLSAAPGAAVAAAPAGPSGEAKRGADLFAAECSGCHELDRAKIGPPLRTVYGRVAGSVPAYPYSPALAGSHLVWNATTLDRWLADPRADIPGAAMPMAEPDAARRAAIIAYLRSLHPSARAEPGTRAAGDPGAVQDTPGAASPAGAAAPPAGAAAPPARAAAGASPATSGRS